MRVHTLERMRRIMVPILLAALFVYLVDHTWLRQAVLSLRRLGGKPGLTTVLVTLATILYSYHHPFPHPKGTYG